ncbi:putative spermidine/putrescine transport system permease protein [Pseudonocardia thermophila]|uniref:Putative spermidine/putrescine transport system permease protein n=1 Tax=Pseudonocardia thermophila TaxID=1848 RepID=A0A1M6ZMI6_PSETH|nr:ABC transporter permease [Pseudonocardia thermophila]SHL31748.1 putative spermidine/putrescine transport system permease protein [Pseudonocardia thermophila]
MRRAPLLWIVVCSVAALLTVPTLFLIPMSLTGGSTFQFPPPSWSLRWYRNLVEDRGWRDAVMVSLQVAVLSTPMAVAIGTGAAFGLMRLGARLRLIGAGALSAPLVIPNILIALAIYGMFLQMGLSGTILGLVLGQTALAVPFVLIAVLARLQGYDRNLTAAALSLGATPATVFRTVTFPLVLPGIVAGGVFAFVASFDELVIALLLQSPRTVTLPVQMFNAVVEAADPTISAASTVLVVVVSAVILVAQIGWTRRSEKRSGSGA